MGWCLRGGVCTECGIATYSGNLIASPALPEDVSLFEAFHSKCCMKSVVLLGIQAITSLLLGTTLRPHMGDPTSSVPMNVHRINEMLFLGSRFVPINQAYLPLYLYPDQVGN